MERMLLIGQKEHGLDLEVIATTNDALGGHSEQEKYLLELAVHKEYVDYTKMWILQQNCRPKAGKNRYSIRRIKIKTVAELVKGD